MADDAMLCGLRCLGERAFALLVCRWRALRHITASPRKIDAIVKAALVLTQFELELKVDEITSLLPVVDSISRDYAARSELDSVFPLHGLPCLSPGFE
jgi:hypothetical protein